jgi:hypothetical protein
MMATNEARRSRPSVRWAELIPDEQWDVLVAGVKAAREAGAPVLLGGALALATYTGRWRNTKDIDLIVKPGHEDDIIARLKAAGFTDYFDQEPYDRSWIFRSCRDGVILDIIWALPNHRVPIDDAWFDHARPVALHGAEYQVVPIEELVRVKLYVMQRERCDWVDVLNALAGSVDQIEWDHLVARMGRDLPLLQAVLTTFAWLSPDRAIAIPAEVRERFALPTVESDDLAALEERRVKLFDSRPWWAAHQPEDKPLER